MVAVDEIVVKGILDIGCGIWGAKEALDIGIVIGEQEIVGSFTGEQVIS